MTTAKWKLVPKLNDADIQAVNRQHQDGQWESCVVTAPEYLKWLEEGNEPLPADEPTVE